MQTPLELNFHDVSRSDWSEALIRERVARLERYRDDIQSCLVIVSQPHQHQHQGRAFQITIEVRLPQHQDLVVKEEPRFVDQESNLRSVIESAFSSMERQLKQSALWHRREEFRPAEGEWRGLVVRLQPELGQGDLRTPEGEEYHFQENAVLHGQFSRLAIGTEVRFTPETGLAGPQASSVQIGNKPGARETEATRDRDDVPPGWRNVVEQSN